MFELYFKNMLKHFKLIVDKFPISFKAIDNF